VGAFLALLIFLLAPSEVLASPGGDNAFGSALKLFAEGVEGAIYSAPGWAPAQRTQALRLGERADLEYRFEQCTRSIAPAECDRQHKWRTIVQTLALTAIKPGSVKVVEVTDAGAPDTSHALIYRCLKNVSCTSGDLGPLARPVIPCRDHASCDRARAALESLIALVQAESSSK
jgi:hypothetical protein